MQYMVAPLREQLKELSPYSSFTLEEKHCCSYYSSYLKRQIKSLTSHICGLILLTQFLQYISHWSKGSEHLATLFLQYT